ncbi:pentatricopeptide repeat-containing protein At2g13600-like [Pistacia vera]|uniref:pentatricopeptide repeat-containing protein At2g13600-like n=1 Tax=Pistacia vera TaxID=55513 RepID=UPI001263CDF7|nr:pentatricopeptide repeat-containing protein At2g13600-like [Pistacia vera]
MLSKSCFPGKWKHKRWKTSKLYSTKDQTQQMQNTHIVSANIAITQRAKVGQLDIARNLFDQMSTRTVVSWNTMISGYSKWENFNESLGLVSTMHRSNFKLNETTFSTTLSVCAQLKSLINGKQIHCLVLKCGYEKFEFVGSSLLYFYAKCLEIEEAKRVFLELRDDSELLWTLMLVGYVQCNLMSEALDVFMNMKRRGVVAWTKLISGYAKSEDGCEKALELFSWMRESGEAMPNEYTFHTAIRACGRLGVLREGRVVHGTLIKYGFEFDHSIGCALIEFYCVCEAANDAKRVYDRIVNPCLSSSNSLINGLILMGRIDEAELIFNRLTEANSVSYNLMIKGYAAMGRVLDSERLFGKMPHRTIISTNTMISVYSRNDEIKKAVELFEETKGERNPVTWNSMMSGYIQNDLHEEALQLYVTLCRLGIDRTRSTFSVLFHACSCLGSLQQGKLLHAHLVKTPFDSNVYVGTSLIDMYSKCGSLTEARASFSSISAPNVAAWTALINGYAHHGHGSEAVLLFLCMLEQEVVPNAATFVGVLSACGRAGLVNEGMKVFHSMERCHRVIPTLEHYACMVDLLGRSGHLQEAEKFIKEMPIEADWVVWGALLSACWFWMNLEVGERVAENIFSLDPKPISAYVIMSNIYAISGKWGEKMLMRKRLTSLEVKKDPACSWIELSNRVYVFSVEDRNDPNCDLIYATLEHLTTNLNSTVHNLNSIVQYD